MNRYLYFSLLFSLFALLCVLQITTLVSNACKNQPTSPLYSLEKSKSSIIHSLRIPNTSSFLVLPVFNNKPQHLEGFLKNNYLKGTPIALLNGGYFDPVNGQTISFVETSDGKLLPRENKRLTENRQLAPFLPTIYNRSEFRVLQCNQTIAYDIQFHQEPIQKGCHLVARLGAGPMLLPKETGRQEAFIRKDPSNNQLLDSIGSKRQNARSAVALMEDGSILLVMIEQSEELKGKGGLSLEELSTWLRSQGAVKALNLDGGSSSSLWIHEKGTTLFGRKNSSGQVVGRPVLSVLAVIQRER